MTDKFRELDELTGGTEDVVPDQGPASEPRREFDSLSERLGSPANKLNPRTAAPRRAYAIALIVLAAASLAGVIRYRNVKKREARAAAAAAAAAEEKAKAGAEQHTVKIEALNPADSTAIRLRAMKDSAAQAQALAQLPDSIQMRDPQALAALRDAGGTAGGRQVVEVPAAGAGLGARPGAPVAGPGRVASGPPAGVGTPAGPGAGIASRPGAQAQGPGGRAVPGGPGAPAPAYGIAARPGLPAGRAPASLGGAAVDPRATGPASGATYGAAGGAYGAAGASRGPDTRGVAGPSTAGRPAARGGAMTPDEYERIDLDVMGDPSLGGLPNDAPPPLSKAELARLKAENEARERQERADSLVREELTLLAGVKSTLTARGERKHRGSLPGTRLGAGGRAGPTGAGGGVGARQLATGDIRAGARVTAVLLEPYNSLTADLITVQARLLQPVRRRDGSVALPAGTMAYGTASVRGLNSGESPRVVIHFRAFQTPGGAFDDGLEALAYDPRDNVPGIVGRVNRQMVRRVLTAGAAAGLAIAGTQSGARRSVFEAPTPREQAQADMATRLNNMAQQQFGGAEGRVQNVVTIPANTPFQLVFGLGQGRAIQQRPQVTPGEAAAPAPDGDPGLPSGAVSPGESGAGAPRRGGADLGALLPPMPSPRRP